LVAEAGSAAAWRWQRQDPAAAPALAPQWRELTSRTHALPFADPLWTTSFWRAFGRPEDRLVLHALYCEERLVAVLPLLRRRLPVPSWCSNASMYTPLPDCAVDLNVAGIAGQILDGLLARVPLLELQPLGSGDLASALLEAGRERGLPVDEEVCGEEAMIEIFGPWQSFCQSLPESVRRHLQKLRQLERQGSVEFREVREAAGLDRVLEECFELEARGWKGMRGSPIRARADTLCFYTELAQSAAQSGRLALYTLRLSGRLIAFELCLRAAERVDALKISYDPELAAQSPGNVLRTLVLRSEVEKGEVRVHHLGLSSPWKLRWATRIAPLHRLRFYRRDLLGRAAHAAGPRLRRKLRSWHWPRAVLQASSRLLRAGAQRPRQGNGPASG
jgi:CelD/BcsL family acetyltransferase involved in cellulose biosynthesis